MKLIATILVITLLLYLGFGLMLYLGQQRAMYFPTPVYAHGYPEEIFETDERINVVVLNPGKHRAALYFGGNGEAVAMNAPVVKELLPDRTWYLVNYRGYGGSTGDPSELGLYSDAQAIFDAISQRHEQVAVIGRSLGSGIATMLAVERDIERLALVTPFDSAVNIARALYPVYPVGLLMRDHYDSLARAPRIRIPTLVIIAENDRIIPRRRSENLIEAFDPNLLDVHVLDDTGHNTVSSHPDYHSMLAEFLAGES